MRFIGGRSLDWLDAVDSLSEAFRFLEKWNKGNRVIEAADLELDDLCLLLSRSIERSQGGIRPFFIDSLEHSRYGCLLYEATTS